MMPTMVMASRNERTAPPKITASPTKSDGPGRLRRITSVPAKTFGKIRPSTKRTSQDDDGEHPTKQREWRHRPQLNDVGEHFFDDRYDRRIGVQRDTLSVRLQFLFAFYLRPNGNVIAVRNRARIEDYIGTDGNEIAIDGSSNGGLTPDQHQVAVYGPVYFSAASD